MDPRQPVLIRNRDGPSSSSPTPKRVKPTTEARQVVESSTPAVARSLDLDEDGMDVADDGKMPRVLSIGSGHARPTVEAHRFRPLPSTRKVGGMATCNMQAHMSSMVFIVTTSSSRSVLLW